MPEIPRIVDFHHNPEDPGWSCPSSQDGKVLKPIIRCNCGNYVGLKLHHVHVDGTVTASFHHKKGNNFGEDPNGCEWHVQLKLKDYDAGEFLPTCE